MFIPSLRTVNFGFVLFGSSPCNFLRSFVRMSLEKSVKPLTPGVGIENFMISISFPLPLCRMSLANEKRGKMFEFSKFSGNISRLDDLYEHFKIDFIFMTLYSHDKSSTCCILFMFFFNHRSYFAGMKRKQRKKILQ